MNNARRVVLTFQRYLRASNGHVLLNFSLPDKYKSSAPLFEMSSSKLAFVTGLCLA